MRHPNFVPNQNRNPAAGPTPPPAPVSTQNAVDFVPSPDEVARRAYFSYVNQGSPQGCHVQHWLQAEAELLAERKLTRTHGFHNQT